MYGRTGVIRGGEQTGCIMHVKQGRISTMSTGIKGRSTKKLLYSE